jgi:nitroimidazol reductase NimA-like FMN-containing flavoprotein (pyridoxamine 5'-phosphate oxidase superfamily)
MEPIVEQLGEDECLRLISPGGVGRLAFTGRYGLTVFPVNYKVHDGSIMFRTAGDSPTGEDLRTGIQYAEYKVAFEIDEIDPAAREGWSVLVHGPAHHMDTSAERALAEEIAVEPWVGGKRDDAVRITPVRITGRRIRRPAGG